MNKFMHFCRIVQFPPGDRDDIPLNQAKCILLSMKTLEQAAEALLIFRNARDWSQFHTSKNLATAISVEAAELNELFLWKTSEEAEHVDPERIADELADIMSYCILMADRHGLNVVEIILNKISKNELRYPVEKAKGKSLKYNEL